MASGPGEKFCLRWNDFENNISNSFRELREDKDFFDITLVCGENQLQAHKVILSACSPFFRAVLKKNPHPHPLLYLKGVKYEEIISVLNFMYHGEVNVAQEDLNAFLAVAEDLEVKGLTQSNKNAPKRQEPITPIPSNLKYKDQDKLDTKASVKESTQDRIRSSVGIKHVQVRKEIPEIVPQIKTEAPLVLDCDIEPEVSREMVETEQYQGDHEEYGYDQSYQEQNMMYQDEEVEMGQMVNNETGGFEKEEFMPWNSNFTNKQFSCDICFKEFSNKKSLQNHRNIHKGRTKCPVCEKVFSTTSNMGLHVRNTHGNVENF